uniref:Pyridine nucleotide-disulfide oxidoreductase domain-containing protein 1-like n=1 Tax=Phallusia mammillata TaxID=59560 RepID=A0A6F9DQR9_9ASCI|nr:pyridine nucleotide-disulfide oxidoreductase domain-containing protein 1-like [Phallusia mammillata]
MICRTLDRFETAALKFTASMENPVFIVVGGGIAGVSCAETINALEPSAKVVIISVSPLIKAVRNVQELTRTLASFDVDETSIKDYSDLHPNISIIHDIVKEINSGEKFVVTGCGETLKYTKLCVCTGARQNVIFSDNKHVVGIRDTASAKELDRKLHNAERLVVVGNGGIAIELIFQIECCNVVWVIKDKAIGQVFFDPGASQFFLPILLNKKTDSSDMKRMTYKLEQSAATKAGHVTGGALGPDWHQNLQLAGQAGQTKEINIQYQAEVETLLSSDQVDHSEVDRKSNKSLWPVYAKLTNGKVLGCDFIVSATGVVPNTEVLTQLPCSFSEDGGVRIDENMRVTGLCGVYAAGDVCSTTAWQKKPHWHQMRLWTQARQMGMFAAQCMISHHKNIQTSNSSDCETPQDICFDLFAHATRFFGKRVILLGRYNAQGIEDSQGLEFLLRTTPGEEYIKVVMLNGRMQGAVLIGETDLEETFENLILNEIDLSMLGEDLLNPDVDITDYFD